MDDFDAFDDQHSARDKPGKKKLGIIPAEALKTARPLHGEARKEAEATGQEQVFMPLPPGHKFGAPAFYSSPDPSSLPVPNLPIGEGVIPAAELTTARPLHGDAKREAKERGEEQVFLALPPGLEKSPPKPKPVLAAKAGLATVAEDSKPALKPKRSKVLKPVVDDAAADVDVSAAFEELDQAFGALAEAEPEKKLDSSTKRFTHADMMADNILSSAAPERGARRQAVALGGEPGSADRRQRRTPVATGDLGSSSQPPRKTPQSPSGDLPGSERRPAWQRQSGDVGSSSRRRPTETDKSLGAATLSNSKDRVRI
jgi:hypothetical protein